MVLRDSQGRFTSGNSGRTTEVRVVIQALAEHVDAVVVRLVLEITANLIETTPVDTGWARANWVASVGQPYEGTVSTREAVDSATQQASLAAVLSYKSSSGSAFVTNNVPYIVFLNEGSSQQAPAAFVQAAIAQAVAIVQGGQA